MARFLVGAAFGVVMVAAAAADVHADPDAVAEAAAEHGLDELALRGAVNTTGLEPRAYLCMTGEGPCPTRPAPAVAVSWDSRVECVIRRESGGNPRAVNPRSGASGLGQFLPSTWRTTPYASSSIFDPVANRAAVAWMLRVGRANEFQVITQGLC